MELNLQGKSVIVTGASSGIGRQVALEFAQEGANVLAVARTAEKLDDLAAEATNQHGTITPFPIDVTTDSASREIANAAKQTAGPANILVNNVGAGRSDNSWETDVSIFHDTMNKNLYSAVRLTQEVVPAMLEAKSGKIINMSSISAHSGLANMPDYNASKAAMTMWSKTIARELAPTIHVNSVAPGFIRTPLWDELAEQLSGSGAGNSTEEVYENTGESLPMKRYGTPEEVSGLVLFLASHRADFITGQNYNIDGGWMQFAF